MNSLTARDATTYWLSTRTRTDLFLLYAFTDTGANPAHLRSLVAARAANIPDLLVRVLDTPANIAYPLWTPCEFTDAQFLDHPLTDPSWANLTAALGELLATAVRADDRPWRLHAFRGIRDAPGFAPGEPALILVLQVSHALADGRHAATLARALFSDSELPRVARDPSPWDRVAAAVGAKAAKTVGVHVATAARSWISKTRPARAAALALPGFPIALARTAIRGFAAANAQRELADLTATGQLPPPAPDVAPTVLNGTGSAPTAHAARILLCPKARLHTPGHTVTVVALTAVSVALERHLAGSGTPVPELRAQVPMAITTAPDVRNSYRDLSIDLAVSEPNLHTRATRIAADLATRRTRADHPLQDAQAAVTAALPAPILHRDVTTFPITVLPERISGHTVLSSVNRGPADFTFAGGRVHFTAGFPALGTVMHLTHGLHGLGDTLTLSIHADPAVLPDMDAYASLLDSAVDEVTAALR